MVQHRFRLVFGFAAAVAFGTLPLASSAQDPFAGSWRAFYPVNGMNCRFDLVMVPTGTYHEIAQCGPYVTSQTGTYRVFPNHTIGRTVTDWTPRTQYVVGSGNQDTRQPPGGMYRYTFTGPNTMVWRDVNFGGTLTYHRK
jgi:hypothetical protein